MRFEEDEDRNLCLVAYPLKGDHGTVDIVDNSDCEPKSKLLRWTNKKHHVLETEKSPKDWVRQHRKEEKIKRWVKTECKCWGLVRVRCLDAKDS